MPIVAVVGPSDFNLCSSIIGFSESYIQDIVLNTGIMLAKQGNSLVSVPYKGTGYFASKGYVNAGGKMLCGILPKGIESKIPCNEVITVDSWIKQPEVLVSRADIMIVIGISAGTLIEICLTKRYKKYPVLVYKCMISLFPKRG